MDNLKSPMKMEPAEIAELWERHKAEGKKMRAVITYDKEKFEAYKTKPMHEWNEDDRFSYRLEVYEKESKRRFFIDTLITAIVIAAAIVAIVMAYVS